MGRRQGRRWKTFWKGRTEECGEGKEDAVADETEKKLGKEHLQSLADSKTSGSDESLDQNQQKLEKGGEEKEVCSAGERAAQGESRGACKAKDRSRAVQENGHNDF